ncbi:unnamed protein product [Brassica oleracea]
MAPDPGPTHVGVQSGLFIWSSMAGKFCFVCSKSFRKHCSVTDLSSTVVLQCSSGSCVFTCFAVDSSDPFASHKHRIFGSRRRKETSRLWSRSWRSPSCLQLPSQC